MGMKVNEEQMAEGRSKITSKVKSIYGQRGSIQAAGAQKAILDLQEALIFLDSNNVGIGRGGIRAQYNNLIYQWCFVSIRNAVNWRHRATKELYSNPGRAGALKKELAVFDTLIADLHSSANSRSSILASEVSQHLLNYFPQIRNSKMLFTSTFDYNYRSLVSDRVSVSNTALASLNEGSPAFIFNQVINEITNTNLNNLEDIYEVAVREIMDKRIAMTFEEKIGFLKTVFNLSENSKELQEYCSNADRGRNWLWPKI